MGEGRAGGVSRQYGALQGHRHPRTTTNRVKAFRWPTAEVPMAAGSHNQDDRQSWAEREWIEVDPRGHWQRCRLLLEPPVEVPMSPGSSESHWQNCPVLSLVASSAPGFWCSTALDLVSSAPGLRCSGAAIWSCSASGAAIQNSGGAVRPALLQASVLQCFGPVLWCSSPGTGSPGPRSPGAPGLGCSGLVSG